MLNMFSHPLHASATLHLGIAADGVALLKCEGRRHPKRSIVFDAALPAGQTANLDTLLQHARSMLSEAQRGGIAKIVLADQWVRMFLVTPPQNTASLEDCRAAAAMRFQELYGESLAAWQLSADWDGRRAFLACAMPKSMVSALHQLVRDYRWTLLSLAPQFVVAWNRWRKQLDGGAWFGAVHGSRLTLGAIDSRSLRGISVAQVADDAWRDEQWLAAHVEREALRMNLAAPKQLRLCGHIPGLAAGKTDVSSFCKRLDALPMRAATSAAVSLAGTGAGE